MDKPVIDFCNEFKVPSRQREIIQLVMEGYRFEEISKRVGKGPRYVNDFMKNFMYNKGFSGRADMMAYIYRLSVGE